MFKNYFKIAWRNIFRSKTFSVINILGLALGLTCSILIMLWVQDEKSIDAFHKNGDRLYQLYERVLINKQSEVFRDAPALMPNELKKIYPEVQYACGLAGYGTGTFAVGDKILKDDGAYAGADFFKMFSYKLLQGNAQTALSSKVGIVISRKMAEAFFGNPQTAMGKTILYQNFLNFKVTGVFENFSPHSSFKFDYLINWETYLGLNAWASNWESNGATAYIMLRKDASASAFEKKLTHFIDNYVKDKFDFGMQPFGDIYLHNQFRNGVVSGGRIEYINLFTIVAIFILLIACINFMNLTTARSIKRAKEIGIRKVSGAARATLIRQFIGEAILITFFAALIALGFVTILLPAFNNYTGKEILLPFNEFSFWISLFGLVLITGIISGSYPALFLSSFNAVQVLKGTLKFSSSAVYFRKGLVVFQFVLSTVFIIGTIVVSKQVDYIQTKNLGYNRENLLYISFEGDLAAKYNLFKMQALNIPGVTLISRIANSSTVITSGTTDVDWEGKGPGDDADFKGASIGYDFIKTMGIQMLNGRDFSKDFASDSAGYIINEVTARKMGHGNPVGRSLTLGEKKGTIIGVVKDFHFNSLHEPIKPLILYFGEAEDWGIALVKIDGAKTKQALQGLQKICKQINPGFPFTYKFSDEEYANLYKSEQMIGSLSTWFAVLAVFISCLGLLGLVMFTAEQRTKEIGIRKVLGASVSGIVQLLSIDFLKLVIAAIVIATPLAWWAMNKWLEDYYYRVDISWWVFALAGLLAIIIAIATICFQAIKAAIANPVKSLRTE